MKYLLSILLFCPIAACYQHRDPEPKYLFNTDVTVVDGFYIGEYGRVMSWHRCAFTPPGADDWYSSICYVIKGQTTIFSDNEEHLQEHNSHK